MAAGDYNVADRRTEAGADVKTDPYTAGDKIGEVTVAAANDPDAVAAAAADTANVRYAAFVDYAAALTALASRADIEGLASRRAREAGDDFADADYMRYDAGRPGPGSVNGEAPLPGANA